MLPENCGRIVDTGSNERTMRSAKIMIINGEVPEWSNGPHSKCVVPFTGDRGFESLPLRH